MGQAKLTEIEYPDNFVQGCGSFNILLSMKLVGPTIRVFRAGRTGFGVLGEVIDAGDTCRWFGNSTQFLLDPKERWTRRRNFSRR